MRVIRLTGITASLSVLTLCLNSPVAECAPEAPKERSFRPVVPIKKSVPERVAQESRIVTVKIPQPLPTAENSLFPEGSVPETVLSPTSEIIDLSPFTPETVSAADTPPSQIKIPREDELVPARREDPPTLARLRVEAHKLAEMGLTYKFGSDNPDTGGLDCSGAVQHLLRSIGVDDVPRTSYQQYDWLKKGKTLDDVYGKNSTSKMLKKLTPGDLIFWGGTWKSGHRVSHVMIYMGYNPEEDKHYVFGARGKSSKGLLGHGVDIFELDPNRGQLVAHGKIPGLKY